MNNLKFKTTAHRSPLTAYRIPLFAFCCFLLLSCGNKNKELTIEDIKNPITAEGINGKENMPEILFDNILYNFGKVIQGEQLSYTFHFKNVGKSKLIIADVHASCGCTSSIPPKAPIMPGEKGEITITFDSKYKSGEVASYLTVTANTYPAQTILTVTANVVVP